MNIKYLKNYQHDFYEFKETQISIWEQFKFQFFSSIINHGFDT